MRRTSVLIGVGLLLSSFDEVRASQAPVPATQTPPRRVATAAPPQLLQELAALLDSGQLAPAKARVQAALSQYPSDAALQNVAGVIEAQLGAHATAERHFRAAIHDDPRMAGAYLNLGRLYQEHAKDDPDAPQKALAVYQKLLLIDATNAEALFQAAYLSACGGEWAASRRWLERLPAHVRSRPQALALLAVDLNGLQDRGRSMEVTIELLAHPDLTEEDVLAIIPALDRAKDDALAERLFAGLDARRMASAATLRQLGLSTARLGRFDDARKVLERAASAAGRPTVPILLELADVAYKQKDFQGSLGYLAHARDLDPQDARVHFFFGMTCVELNLGSEAYDALKKAVALAPDNPYVNYALGAVAMHRHEPSDAMPYFERYVRLKPDDPRGRFALGAARFYSNEFEAASSDLEQAVRFPETAVGARYFLGRIARQLNQLDKAREEIGLALKANPQYADAIAELGLLQTRSGEYELAERSLIKALAIDPENYAATFNLTTLYARTKDPRREEQEARLAALQQKRAVAAQEFLRIIQVVPYEMPIGKGEDGKQ